MTLSNKMKTEKVLPESKGALSFVDQLADEHGLCPSIHVPDFGGDMPTSIFVNRGGGEAIGVLMFVFFPAMGYKVADDVVNAEYSDCDEAGGFPSCLSALLERKKPGNEDRVKLVHFEASGKPFALSSTWDPVYVHGACYSVHSGTARLAGHNVAWTTHDGAFTFYDDVKTDDLYGMHRRDNPLEGFSEMMRKGRGRDTYLPKLIILVPCEEEARQAASRWN